MQYLHLKSGGVYRVIALAVAESNLEATVVYQNIQTGVVWTRPAKEFFDGRFVPDLGTPTGPKDGRLLN